MATKPTSKTKPKVDAVTRAKTQALPPGQYIVKGVIVDAWGKPVGK